MLQLHGDEGPAYCREAARRTGCQVIKAVRVRTPPRCATCARSTPTSICSTPTSPAHAGGTGETFDWELARHHLGTVPLMLSGGLDAGQRRRGDRGGRPFAVDCASGTEAAPGRKDPAKLDGVLRARSRQPTRGRSRRHERPAVERRFGPYGGRYVPETLIPALDELEREWVAARADPGVQGELSALLRDYVGRPTPLYRAAGCRRRPARRSTSSARTSPHRLAQDQQRARPGAAGAADGQAADDRRDRRRPARRGRGHRVRAARPRVHRLHGHRGHAPPAPQRRADEAARRRGGRRSRRGRGRSRRPVSAAIRDWVGERRRHPLRDRLGGRARRPTRRSCATCSG